MCECTNMTIYGSIDVGQHHNVNCQKYKTEKFKYLFYYECGYDSFVPAPEKVDNILNLEDLDIGESQMIEFKCVSLTDKEYDDLPED